MPITFGIVFIEPTLLFILNTLKLLRESLESVRLGGPMIRTAEMYLYVPDPLLALKRTVPVLWL
jgi:hypothetical protein